MKPHADDLKARIDILEARIASLIAARIAYPDNKTTKDAIAKARADLKWLKIARHRANSFREKKKNST